MRDKYVHAEKAGNLHDVWKHYILTQYMNLCSDLKDIIYIDTHSGALGYRNICTEQLLTGIGKFPNLIDDVPNSPYLDALNFYGAKGLRVENKLTLLYPGSLAFVAYCLLKTSGKIVGCELDQDIIKKTNRNIRIFKKVTKTRLQFESIYTDGYKYAKRTLSENSESHGVVFVDPTYFPNEKLDWIRCIRLINTFKNKKNWSFVLWYSIYSNDESSHLGYYKQFKKAVSKNKLYGIDIQLQISPLTNKYKKCITGMYIINPLINSESLVRELEKSGIQKIAALLAEKKYKPKIRISEAGYL